MTYRIKAIPMTLSRLQGQSYCQHFQCDFHARDAMLVRHLRVCPSVRSSQVDAVLRRLNVGFQKTTPQDSPEKRFTVQRSCTKFWWNLFQRERQMQVL